MMLDNIVYFLLSCAFIIFDYYFLQSTKLLAYTLKLQV